MKSHIHSDQNKTEHPLKKMGRIGGTISVIAGMAYFQINNHQDNLSQERNNVQHQIGTERMNAYDFEGAIEAFYVVLEDKENIEPKNIATVYQNIATNYADLREPEKAIEALELSQNYLTAGSLEYVANQGDIALMQGDIGEALESYGQAIKIDPTDFYTHNMLGSVYLGEHDKSFTDYDKALVHNLHALESAQGFHIALAHRALGLTHLFLNDLDGAQEMFEALEVLSPDDEDTVIYLAMIYIKNKDPRAEEYKQKSLAMDPKNEAFFQDISADTE
jgi:tetratricopeptide (TPR) repeat protein